MESSYREIQSGGNAAAEASHYTIRLPDTTGPARCGHCGQSFHAAGPVGYDGEQMLCDLCMIERSKPLGMVLAVIAATRGVGALERPEDENAFRMLIDALLDFFTFARLYELFAARFGPNRMDYRLADLEDRS